MVAKLKMFRTKKTPKVKFYGSDLLDEVCANPRPANKFIPEWFKNLPPYLGVDGSKSKKTKVLTQEGIKGNGTIKKCVPVLDAFCMGYMIPLPFDLIVKKHTDGAEFAWTFGGCAGLETAMSSHAPEQLTGCPMSSGTNDDTYHKLHNPWHIHTPKGYSCLITTPLNRGELPIQILSGVVDTDNYHTINFPFILNVEEGEHLIEAGTPLAQVIPFKRERWESEVENLTEDRVGRSRALIDTFMHEYYKRRHHVKKSFT